MEKLRLMVILGLIGLILPGCALTRKGYSVTVSSVADGTFSGGARYTLLPCNRETARDEEQFRNFAALTAKTLKDLGYEEADTVDAADMVILAAYGIGSREDACLPARAARQPHVLMHPRLVVLASSRLPPVMPHMSTKTVKLRYLILLAVDRARYLESGEIAPLWRTTAVSSGYLADLRIILPAMLKACTPYIGKTSEKEVIVRVEASEGASAPGENAP